MAKDPAFLFYSNDFLSGIQDLTMEERGQYITLLCLHHQKGRLTQKMIRLCCGNAAADVLAKFRQDDNGHYYNERLECEIEKRKVNSEIHRKKAIDGWKKRRINAGSMPDHMPRHMHLENENENENIERIEGEGRKDKFNQWPLPEHFNGLPDVTLGSVKELVSITKKINLTDDEIKGMWGVFKNQSLTGKKFYQDQNDVYSHFINWMKIQKFKDNGQQQQQGTTSSGVRTNAKTTGAHQLAANLKEQFNKNNQQ